MCCWEETKAVRRRLPVDKAARRMSDPKESKFTVDTQKIKTDPKLWTDNLLLGFYLPFHNLVSTYEEEDNLLVNSGQGPDVERILFAYSFHLSVNYLS